MAIRLICGVCHTTLQAPDHFAGCQARCPGCSAQLTVPAATPEPIIEAEIVEEPPPPPAKGASPWDMRFLDDLHEPIEVAEYLEPPRAKPAPPRPSSTAAAAAPMPSAGDWMRRMFEAMLDPRSIQWLLALGGGLMVLGLLIWLISTGLFKNAFALAIVFGVASLALLVGGWFVTLKTHYRIAGRALTFLGCVVAPLNLWFYHAQGLLALEHGLWLGGVACVVLYIATVVAMRDGLFMYAVEVGVTLTAVLLLGSFGLAGQATQLSILLMGLALASIHAGLVFPDAAETFDRRRFGLPLFWCGHAQLAASLVILMFTQIAGWMEPIVNLFQLPEGGVLLTNSRWASGLLWLAGAYAYLYSDFVVRRIGVYTYLAAVALVMAEVTLLGFDVLGVEGLIAALAVTATAVSLLTKFIPPTDARMARTIGPLALVLSALPVVIGIFLHMRATSMIAAELHIEFVTTWKFVIVMLVVAVANRVSAYIYQNVSAGLSAVYFLFSAGALIVAAAGWLRILEVPWLEQMLLLMLIPIGYLIAARLWRGRAPERPLGWVAHAATAVILAHAMFGAMQLVATRQFDDRTHLFLALLLIEAALFYGLAAVVRRKSANVYFAVVAGCGAAWQAMLYCHLPQPLFTILFAAAGLAMIFAARSLGLCETRVFDAAGSERTVTRGRGLAVLWAGHGVLSMAIVVAFAGGLVKLAAVGFEQRSLGWLDWFSLGLLTAASAVAAVTSPRGSWRNAYWVAAIALAGLAFLMVNIAIDLSAWRKLEIFLVAVGLLLLAAGYIGRFREEAGASASSDMVSLGLWLGSFLTAFPLLVAVFHHWATAEQFAVYDELFLLAVTIMMVASGIVWQVKASTLLGGAALATYLVVLIVSLIYQPQVYIGIYLAAGGAMVFLLGLLLAVYRDRLIALPQRIANRQGVFRVIGWR